ncbi:TPA: hypothetical protein ROF92_000069 [Citrobacter freundii]|nr:hypothetical protein [Enterobacter roggenkampii]ELN9573409.1 hypothetical protein [Enterobacter roggenkampii]HDX4057236.1 hypothetical protein [Citrobacter freundii]
MKFIGYICFFIVLMWAASSLLGKDKSQTVNEKLITQFEKRDVVKRHEWNKGKVIDGVQVYTARKDYVILQSIWGLGVKEASVIILTTGKTPQVEIPVVLGQCVQLAKVVMDSDAESITDAVSTIFTAAIQTYKKEGKKVEASGDIGSTPFSVTVQDISSVLTYGCGVDLK